jgi:hypothetical protein
MVDRSRSSGLGHCESLRDEVSRSTAEAGKKFHSQAEADSAEEQILGGIAETPAMACFFLLCRGLAVIGNSVSDPRASATGPREPLFTSAAHDLL